jgi:hypothetical protein
MKVALTGATGFIGSHILLHQGTAAARVRAELGWYPSDPSLTDEFRRGSYRK